MTGPRRPDLDEHSRWDALAVGWTLSALDPDDQASMAAHLPDCERCTATVRETLRTVEELAYAAPDEEPPARLKRRIMAAAAAEPRAPAGTARPPAPVVRPRSRRRRWLTRVAVAAAAALIAALVSWNVQLRADRDDLRQVAAQREELVQRLTGQGAAQIAIIRRPNGIGERYATVVVKDGRIGLITETLPPQAGDATYWLWSLTGPDDPSPVPLAGFRVPATRFSTCNIEPPAGIDARAFAISAEPGPQRPAKPTELVGLGITTTN